MNTKRFIVPEGISIIEREKDRVDRNNHTWEVPKDATEIIIPNSVTMIEYGAFWDCRSLTAIRVAPGNPVFHDEGGALFEGTKLHTFPMGLGRKVKEYATPPMVTEIGKGAFAYCERLTEVKIPNSVKVIGDKAFIFCKSLVRLVIPDSVTEIEDRAFYACYSLTKINIPGSVRKIGKEAFGCCTSLTEANIPDTVKMKKDAFIGTSLLTDVKTAEDDRFGGRISLNIYWDLDVLEHVLAVFISALKMHESGRLVPIPKEISKTCISIKNLIKEKYYLECYSAFENSKEAVVATKDIEDNLDLIGPEIPESIDSKQFYSSTVDVLSSHTCLFGPSVLAELLLILKTANAILKKSG